MSKKIIIYDGCETKEELAKQLREIAGMIADGDDWGDNPGWEIIEDEDE